MTRRPGARRRLATILAFATFAVLPGCGGGGGGGGGGGHGGGWDAAPVPLEWKAGAQFGYAVFDVPAKDPRTFGDPTCTFTAHLAEATEAGGLPVSDEEGACVVTTATDLRGLAPDPAPACAGQVLLEYADRSPELTVCPDASFPSPTELDCAAASGAGMVHITSGPDETDGDRLGGLEVTLERLPAPVITAPDLLPSDSTTWPAEGDLTVGWEPVEDLLRGEAVEVVLRASDGTGPMVRCVVEDAGEAVVPARLADAYRGAEALVEVARIAQARGDVDGFDFRASARTSDTFRLYPR